MYQNLKFSNIFLTSEKKRINSKKEHICNAKKKKKKKKKKKGFSPHKYNGGGNFKKEWNKYRISNFTLKCRIKCYKH